MARDPYDRLTPNSLNRATKSGCKASSPCSCDWKARGQTGKFATTHYLLDPQSVRLVVIGVGRDGDFGDWVFFELVHDDLD